MYKTCTVEFFLSVWKLKEKAFVSYLSHSTAVKQEDHIVDADPSLIYFHFSFDTRSRSVLFASYIAPRMDDKE